jgi:hypothetical protein
LFFGHPHGHLRLSKKYYRQPQLKSVISVETALLRVNRRWQGCKGRKTNDFLPLRGKAGDVGLKVKKAAFP